MVDPDFLSYLMKKVRERRAIIADRVMDGGCYNFEDYRHKMGALAAFDEVLEILKKLAERYDLDD